jgi:S-adenosylmethionine:tRNA ribosyltransferase-isomerase
MGPFFDCPKLSALWARVCRRPGVFKLRTSEFDFDLPPELIAQHPIEPRDRARLMVVRRTGAIEHRTFSDLPEILAPGDVLVRNNTRVVPARLLGKRELTGGAWEGLFLRDQAGFWELLAKTRGRVQNGERIAVEGGLILQVEHRDPDGRWLVRPLSADPTFVLLERHGHVPLPPYIRKGKDGPEDRGRYQTVFAQVSGAVAAPTAGLHFTPELNLILANRGIRHVDLTLHVGIGTFRPIEAEIIEDHTIHAEWAELSAAAADALNAKRRQGSQIVAVGTTSARVLETAARQGAGSIGAFSGETSLFIRPGHQFLATDALITNFHLPRSSLLVLVSALAGIDLIRQAYAEAIRKRYRFYSYGDAMLIIANESTPEHLRRELASAKGSVDGPDCRRAQRTP